MFIEGIEGAQPLEMDALQTCQIQEHHEEQYDVLSYNPYIEYGMGTVTPAVVLYRFHVIGAGFRKGFGRGYVLTARIYSTLIDVPVGHHFMTIMGWSNSTACPSDTSICSTTPSNSDCISFMSFMDSIIIITSPFLTSSPVFTKGGLSGEGAE